jgi:hypothetical protein
MMRRLLAVSAAVGLLVACTSFSSEGGSSGADGDAGAGGGPDGAPMESGAGGDALAVDGPVPDARTTDASADGGAADPRCTVFGGNPAATPGWASDTSLGGMLTAASHDGRPAMDARVETINARARLVQSFTPGPGGEVTVIVDIAALTSPGFSGSLVELVSVSCGTPPQKVALDVDNAGQLVVDATPSASPPVLLGAPPASWTTLTLTATLTAVTVKFGSSTDSVTMATSFTGAAGCTVGIGALATGNIGVTQAFYARACIE